MQTYCEMHSVIDLIEMKCICTYCC